MKSKWTPTADSYLGALKDKGYSNREIADRLQTTPKAVERRWSRIQKRAAKALDKISQHTKELTEKRAERIQATLNDEPPYKKEDLEKEGLAWSCNQPVPVNPMLEVIAKPFPPNMGEVVDKTFAPVGKGTLDELIVSAPEEEDKTKVDYWKRLYKEARRELNDLRHARTAVDELCDVAREAAPKAYETAPPLANWKPHTHGTPQDAVLLLSDTHIGKVVEPDQTMELGCYNFELFLRRLARLERSVKSILQDHTTTDVPTVHVCMLGDMLDGALVHSVEAGQENTMFEQLYSAGHALAQFLRGLSQVAKVEVRTSVGNHTRWQNQRKMPTTNVYSNFDQVLYAYVEALTHDCAKFYLDKQPFARFQVCGWNFIATHGTHLRGGDRVLGIPSHSIGRNVMAHAQLAVRSGQPVPNYYCVGHLHRPIEVPHTLGDFTVNGAFPGVDGFGLMEAFNSSRPLQRFFLVHPEFGKTADYKLFLDKGDREEHHYTLPDKFRCR